MYLRFLASGLALCCLITGSASGNDVLSKLDRTIVREPKYENRPRYALLVFGDRAEHLIWVVEDGKSLYLDRNGNKDLSDDGPTILPSDVRSLGQTETGQPRYDFTYVLKEFGPAGSPRHTDFALRRWNYDGQKQDSYGLSLKVDGAVPMYSGWFNRFWATTPKEAPVFHFAGPVHPRIMRSQEFVVGQSLDRLSICFWNTGLDKADATRLSIDSLPPELELKAEIDWPVAEGTEPLKTTHTLNERCCYWEFYTTTFRAPATTVPGRATVTIYVPAGFPLSLATNQFEVPVVAKPSTTK
jgi:hypothetical protein